MSLNLTIGGDFEFFQKKRNKIVPATLNDSQLADIENDGFLGEIHPHYNTCRELFIDNIEGLLNVMHGRDIEFDFSSIIHIIPDPIYDKLTDEQKALGCKPEISAYTGKAIPKPKETKLRSSGGHIHIGINVSVIPQKHIYVDPYRNEYNLVVLENRINEYANGDINSVAHIRIKENIVRKIIRLLDAYLAILDVAINPRPEEALRRTVYGSAGAYRITQWGYEYRVLSSWYVIHIPLVSLYYAIARELTLHYYDYDVDLPEDLIIEIVNTANKEMAEKFVRDHSEVYSMILKRQEIRKLDFNTIYSMSKLDNFEELMMRHERNRWGRRRVNGIKTFVDNFCNINKDFRSKRWI